MIVFKIVAWFFQWVFILFIITNKMAHNTITTNDIAVGYISKVFKSYWRKRRLRRSKRKMA